MKAMYTVCDCCVKDGCNVECSQSSVMRKRSREVWGRRVVEVTHDSHSPSSEYRDTHSIIRESVDSLCRDDADMPMTPYIGKAYNRPDAAFVSLFR